MKSLSRSSISTAIELFIHRCWPKHTIRNVNTGEPNYWLEKFFAAFRVKCVDPLFLSISKKKFDRARISLFDEIEKFVYGFKKRLHIPGQMQHKIVPSRESSIAVEMERCRNDFTPHNGFHSNICRVECVPQENWRHCICAVIANTSKPSKNMHVDRQYTFLNASIALQCAYPRDSSSNNSTSYLERALNIQCTFHVDQCCIDIECGLCICATIKCGSRGRSSNRWSKCQCSLSYNCELLRLVIWLKSCQLRIDWIDCTVGFGWLSYVKIRIFFVFLTFL